MAASAAAAAGGTAPDAWRLHRNCSSCCLCRLYHRKLTRKRIFCLVLVFSLACLIYYQGKTEAPVKMRQHLSPRTFCPAQQLTSLNSNSSTSSSRSSFDDLKMWGTRNKNSAHVLVFSRTASSFRDLTDFLGANRIKFKTSASGRNLPDLIKLSRGGVGKYYLIIFEDIRNYYMMDKWNRDILEKYCRQFKAGILGFLPSGADRVDNENIIDPGPGHGSPFTYTSHLGLGEGGVRALAHPYLKTLRADVAAVPRYQTNLWVGFESRAPHLQPILLANLTSSASPEGRELPLALHEPGTENRSDRIEKIIIGGSGAMQFWLLRLVVLDAMQFLSNSQIVFPLTRYVLIDVDDIFVGAARLTRLDVAAMAESQTRLARHIRGFRYNLGFSGSYFLHGNEYEDEGDEELITLREKFWWFPHMWNHIQPHKLDNITHLVTRMELNKAFAEEKGLPVENQYSVAPHHSGVYPVHQQLYDAWRQVWDIEVTSTEEYPNLRPAKRRRGFIHSGISVIPRQTCGLYTKNLYYEEYPNGVQNLEASIEGGELFQTLVTNPISVFMTHMPNYCCDRLAPYTFESVVNFISCYTNLNLRTVTPRQLADKYFSLFPEEETAVWGNPCLDHRHREIWSVAKSCRKLPDFLVIGPQKTGSTALYSFLKLHPNITSNLNSPDTYEEVQFFNGKNYKKGIDWYMEFFPEAPDIDHHPSEKSDSQGNVSSSVESPSSSGSHYLFEKSATYFDGEYVPSRAHRLLPEANIIAILIPPEKRAYSWYYHMRAHADPTAINFSFKQVVMAGPDSPRALLSLQSRCLEPGKYAYFLEKWLLFYRAKQLHILDGEELKFDPIAVMNRLQHYLQISPFSDYKDKLVFDKRKGFYCLLVQGQKKCLGKGKGRKYPPMDEETLQWLQKYYKHHNEALVKLMGRLGYPVPSWLKDNLDVPS